MNQALKYYSLVLDILCVIYFLTSIIMPEPQTIDMRQILQKSLLFLCRQLALASCKFYV